MQTEPKPLQTPKRFLVIAPHPDDITLSGGLAIRTLKSGGLVHLMALTSGDAPDPLSFITRRWIQAQNFNLGCDPVQGVARYREIEDARALHLLGLSEEHCTYLRLPDQGIRDQLDRKSPTLLDPLCEILTRFRPDMVSVPHPNDHHPDHSASWFAIQLACQNVGLHPTLICPIDAYAMDLPLRWVPELRFRVEKHSPSKNDWLEIELSSEEHSLKKAMIDCYPSQMAWEHPWQTSAQLSTRSYLYGYLAQNELYALPTQVQEDRVWSAELSQKIFKKRLLHFLRGLFLLKSLPKE